MLLSEHLNSGNLKSFFINGLFGYKDVKIPFFNNCKNLYIRLQKEFHDAVELLNVWIACQREKKADVKLSGLDISNLVLIDLDNINSNYTIDDLHTKFPKEITVAQEELDFKAESATFTRASKKF